MHFRLANLFPEGTYTHQMGFQRGDFAQFFSSTEFHASIVEQRRQWLETDPQKYAALLPEGSDLLDETIELAVRHNTLSPNAAAAIQHQSTAWDRCLTLGK